MIGRGSIRRAPVSGPSWPRGRHGGATLGLVMLAVLGPAPAASGQGLDIPLIGQRAKLWCWAAAAEMVLDHFATSGLPQENLGQCDIVKKVPDGKSCACTPPNGYDATGGCDFGNPFDEKKDNLPGLLGAVRSKQGTSGAALHRDLLACEIHTRRRPVLTWWRDKASKCHKGGHVVVVADIVRGQDAKEDLVLVLDPLPEKQGDSYWLTWLGYTCGYKLGGHCVDYYDIPGPAEVPESCAATPELDPVSCDARQAEFDPLPLAGVQVSVSELLAGELGARLRSGLDVPESVTRVDCDGALLVHRATIEFEGAEPALRRVGSSRLVCRADGGTWRSPFSILVLGGEGQGWRLAGFGSPATATLIQQGAGPLVSSWAKAHPGTPGPPELYEVEIPGTGDLLLIEPNSPAKPSVNLQNPERGIRSLGAALTDPVAGAGSQSLEAWLRSFSVVD